MDNELVALLAKMLVLHPVQSTILFAIFMFFIVCLVRGWPEGFIETIKGFFPDKEEDDDEYEDIAGRYIIKSVKIDGKDLNFKSLEIEVEDAPTE